MMQGQGTTAIRDRLRSYLAELFPADAGLSLPEDNDDLLEILDSLQILRMVIDLEGVYGIKVLPSELTADNLGTLAGIVRFVARKSGGRD